MNTSPIPEFKLKDDTGQVVDFHVSLWGAKQQNYDFEKPHRHNFNEVMVFDKGGGTHDIDFTTYEALSRSVHFVGSDNVHLVLRGNRSSGCSLLFSDDFLSKELIGQLPFSKTSPVLNLSLADFKPINTLLSTIKAEYAEKQPGYQEILKAYLQAFMLQLMRIYKNQHPEETEKNTKPDIIVKFMDLLSDYHLSHYSVEQYAACLNISAKHLIDVCKSHTGKTPLRHIKQHTVAETKKLLFNTKLSVKEIAYQMGFDDPANFSKYFKSVTNYTPLEYREGIR